MTIIASSRSSSEVSHNLKLIGIECDVNAVVNGSDVAHSKPAPDIFVAALDELQKQRPVHARDALVIGDTPYDAQAAAGAGLETLGLLCGGFSEQELRAAGSDAVYRDPSDLLAHYDDSPARPFTRHAQRKSA